jgi:hypothetical protein
MEFGDFTFKNLSFIHFAFNPHKDIIIRVPFQNKRRTLQS